VNSAARGQRDAEINLGRIRDRTGKRLTQIGIRLSQLSQLLVQLAGKETKGASNEVILFTFASKI
jgi:hypothetical protein